MWWPLLKQWPSRRGAQAWLICYNLFGSGAALVRFYMGGLHDVARETTFEAHEWGESRNGIGSRWCLLAGGRRIGAPKEVENLLPSNLDLFFEYGPVADALDGSEVQTPALHGASGCSVWQLQPHATMWWPPRVIGVQVAFFSKRYFRAISWRAVGHLLRLVDKELESESAARLDRKFAAKQWALRPAFHNFDGMVVTAGYKLASLRRVTVGPNERLSCNNFTVPPSPVRNREQRVQAAPNALLNVICRLAIHPLLACELRLWPRHSNVPTVD